MRGKKGNRQGYPFVPLKGKERKNTNNIELAKESVRILWNYIIEVQDLVAEIVALLDNPERPGVAQLLRAGQKPEEILADMIAAAKGEPIRATGK